MDNNSNNNNCNSNNCNNSNNEYYIVENINSNSNSENSNNSMDEITNKIPFYKHKYFKQFIVLYLYLYLYFLAAFLYDIFIPSMLLNMVQEKFPNYTTDEQASKSSFYKSFSDAMPFVTMFIFGPLLGFMSDKYGRKFTFYLAISAFIVDLISCLISIKTNNIYLYYVFHSIGGIHNIATSAVFSFIYDVSEDRLLPLLFSLSGLSMGAGTTTGSLIYAFANSSNWLFNLYLSGGIALLCLSTVPFLIETIFINREKQKEKKLKDEIITTTTTGDVDVVLDQSTTPQTLNSKINPFDSLKTLFTTNWFITFTILLFLSDQYSGADVWSTFYYYSYLMYGWGSKDTGLFVFYLGISTVLFATVISPTLLRKLNVSERVLITIGFGTTLIAHIILIFSKHSQYMFIVAACLTGVTPTVANLVASVVSKATPPEVQGAVLLGLQSVKAIGSCAGSLVANNVFMWSLSNDTLYFPQAIFFLNSIVIGITMIGSIIIWRFYNSKFVNNNNIIMLDQLNNEIK